MKFTLTITDASIEEIVKLLSSQQVVAGSIEDPNAALDQAETLMNGAEGILNEVEALNPLAGTPDAIAAPAEDPAPVETPEFDAQNLPWDERIHAGTKTQNKDGTWKKKRGVDAAFVATVEEELRLSAKNAALPEGAVPVTPTPGPELAAPGVPEELQPGPVQSVATGGGAAIQTPVQPVTTPAAPEPVAPPADTAPAPVAQEGGEVTFQTLMQTLQEALTAKKVDNNFTQELVANINTTFGSQCASIVDISGNQAMIVHAKTMIDQKVAA